ncbi:Spy/CpxP family protein refolding chaperone [Flavobacterium sp.]|uniref:Spy/CpxP family protein refolding chaperone n=1 Tax=Flavobacterium sp. TaxID=239 RepID=UPI00263928EC|nr:Spy/CpxP family protein refolding chaperone [Flavobacterium sp.]
MKKFVFVFALVLGLTISGTAQGKQPLKGDTTEKLTLQQRNELHLKKMTLDLDLTPSQQKEIAVIINAQSAEREAKIAERKEAKKPLTADEKFAMKSKMLDKKIEMKAKMKKILNEDQMKKWEENQEKRGTQMHKRRSQHKQKTAKEVSE